MNKTISTKYCITPNDAEKRTLSSKNFRIGFNFDRIKTVKKVHNALDKYLKKEKAWEDLATGENVLLLVRGKFYKISVQSISFFNKESLLYLTKTK